MTPVEAKKRIIALRKQGAGHDELYYRKAKPEITDREYDRLKLRYLRLVPLVVLVAPLALFAQTAPTSNTAMDDIVTDA